MHKRARTLAADRHQPVDPRQYEDAWHAGVGEQRRNPLVRPELRRRRHHHAQHHEQKQRMETGRIHGLRRDTLLDSFGARERLPEKHRSVDDKWQQHDGELHLVAEAGLAQEVRQDAADDNASREPHVKVVQFGRLVRGVQGCDERIARRLHRAVGNAEQQRAQIEAPEIPGKDREEDGRKVPDKRDGNDPAEPEDIAQGPADHHRERKTPESGVINPADLLLAEVEGGCPRTHGRAPQRKAHGRDHQGDPARRKKTGCVCCHDRSVFEGFKAVQGFNA